jgi:hypothetical protein
VAIDTLWDKTVLLLQLSEDLQDASALRRPFAAYGNAGLSSAVGTPFGAGKACYFDGTGDYLRCPVQSADFNLGTGDFDLAAWIYIDGDSAVNGSSQRNATILSVDNGSSASTLEFMIGGSGSVTGTHLFLWNGTTGISGTGTISKDVWHFVRAKRVSGTVTFYLDEVQLGSSGSYNVQFGSSTQNLHIGGRSITNYNDILNGYICNVRITKGEARPTGLPTAPFPRPTISGHVYDDAAAPAAKTVLVFDRSTQSYLGGANSDPSTGAYVFYPATFGEVTVCRVDELADPMTDECVFDLDPSRGVVGGQLVADTNGHALSYYNDAKINADGISFEFDGSADSIYSTSTDYILGTDDFCLDLEFYPITGGHGSAYARLLQIGANASAGTLAIVAYASDNPMKLEMLYHNGSAWVHIVGANLTVSFSDSNWHKLQLRRAGGTCTVTVDDSTWGTLGGTAYNFTSSQLYIGGNATNTESFKGRIGKVRISRGARRAAAATPTSRLLKMPADGGSGENAIIYDRVIPGS